MAKLAYAEENKRVYDLCMDLLGSDAMLFPAGYPMVRPDHVGMGSPDVRKMFLRVRANSIEGGTSEVMRNILGERVLGLPGRRPHRQGAPLEGRAAQLSAHQS